jgi:hypothetical protein
MALSFSKLDKVWPKLSKEMRVAVACVAIERVRPLYELGNFKLTVKDVGATGKYPADKDLVELGLELGWGFVAGKTPDKPTREAIEKWIKAKILHKKAAKTVSSAGRGACKAVYHALRATDVEDGMHIEQAITMAEVGVSNTVRNMGIGDDKNDIPTKVGKKEQAWHLSVVEHALAAGKKKPSRAMFEELLKEGSAFDPYLDLYKKKYGKKK